ncbi:uncharacterized protein LOC124116530 isoform X2 [Haliotis rufescens]|uniref:uncharacterized protein LOC124116530 isoform X2 n=1 Tax=Haliotis rufescens TaxID=6454 RepID=UPI00201F6C89|nr:uncharacterized protein LOC124116530 isoform X2 [Haliotis rufescens]
MADPENIRCENLNPAQQNQEAESTLESIADDLNKLHHYNNVCDIIFRALSLFGCIFVIVAFGLLFHEEYFKNSDPLAAVGAAISIVANIGLLVNGRKLRYDNRRCIKKDLLPKFPGPVSERVLQGITDISLQPEDSAISRLPEWCRRVCRKCGCCCREHCLPDDPLEPMCTIDPSKCLCCKCSCPRAKCPNFCEYMCSCFTFLLTFELFESIYYIVSSGWVLCSNVHAIIDRFHHKHGQMIFNELSVWSRASEGFDVAIAIFTLLLTLVKCKKRTEERPVIEIRKLVPNVNK